MKARLPIELDLPPHTCQKDEEDDNSTEKLMVNLKLLCENEMMLIKIFSKHRPPRFPMLLNTCNLVRCCRALCVWNSEQILVPLMFVLYPEVKNVSDLNNDC